MSLSGFLLTVLASGLLGFMFGVAFGQDYKITLRRF